MSSNQVAEYHYDENGVAEYDDTPSVESDRFAIDLPDRQSVEGITALIETLKDRSTQRGVPTLAKWLPKYLRQVGLANDHWKRAIAAADFVNGVRSSGQKKGDRKRSLRNEARGFYEALSTPALRMHCKLFDIDYDQYGTMEEVITDLVQKHVNMVGVV